MNRKELRKELHYNLDEKTKFIIKQKGSTYDMFKKFEDKVIELEEELIHKNDIITAYRKRGS